MCHNIIEHTSSFVTKLHLQRQGVHALKPGSANVNRLLAPVAWQHATIVRRFHVNFEARAALRIKDCRPRPSYVWIRYVNLRLVCSSSHRARKKGGFEGKTTAFYVRLFFTHFRRNLSSSHPQRRGSAVTYEVGYYVCVCFLAFRCYYFR